MVEQTVGTFLVTVADQGQTTTHTVRVPEALPRALGCPSIPVVELVRASFAFLLAREPATSILREFSLEQIGHYFPDYPDTMARESADWTDA